MWVPEGMEYDPTLGLLLPAGVGVHVNLVMTDMAAFGITEQPAQLFGLGPIPADMARELVKTAQTRHAATLRRLYTEPVSGALMKMESSARTFPDGLGQMISIRDGHCRYPFCDAPIRHLDHIQPHADGGATSYGNGQGLCARHNLLKETNHTTTHPEPDGAGLCSQDGQDGEGVLSASSHGGPGGADGRGGHDGEAGHGSPDGPSGPSSPGGGAVITILGGGMKFTSPARAFPTESPTSVAEDHYWRGYREGRADQRQQQQQREHELQAQENAFYTAEDRLRQLAARLLDNGAA
ncbi:MAG: HNH endonuclease signature motif containing protein [Galactobacter sp.]